MTQTWRFFSANLAGGDRRGHRTAWAAAQRAERLGHFGACGVDAGGVDAEAALEKARLAATEAAETEE